MKLAQSLYEQGHITYMRTDSVALSEDYCLQARKWLQQHDPQNVPERVATQRSKAGAQEAHEAIRPTHVEYTPGNLSSKLSEDEAKLYNLIWGRALASQCKPAQLQKTRIVTQSGEVFWQALGQVITFCGYTIYWNDLSKDSQLPTVQKQQRLTLKDAGSEKKQSSPPPRYTEPKLVQVMEKKGIGRPSTYAPTVKVLRDRNYASLIKGHLQPTQLGMEVDEFLMRVLPKMVEPEFTAEMESALDDVAAGKQQWERYLINWNQTYFAPALEAAYRSLGTSLDVTSSGSRKAAKPSAASGGNRKAAKPGAASGGNKKAALTEIHCPKCEWLMQKIACNSKKIEADHFLKCSNQDCGTAMFWSVKNQGYSLPYSERQESTQKENRVNTATGIPVFQPKTHGNTSPPSPATGSNITDHLCPVCGQPLELYEYTKEGQQKQMLRCSDAGARRRDDHKNVAYFAAKGGFWSPTYGEIAKQSSSPKSARDVSKDTAVAPPAFSRPTTEHPCPVCGKPLELYEYIKENQQKQMLRCSDVQARRRDDHKDAVYFASKGVFWSPKYGEVGSASQASSTKISSKSSASKAESKSSRLNRKNKATK
jgi:DNA topoisomerase-1